MNYQFKNNSEFHVWDVGGDAEQVARISFESSWMSKVLRPGDRVLDIGCGAGYTVETLQALGFQALGVDLNSELIAKAKARNINVVEEDALQAIRSRLTDFDVVCMSDFIEHVPLKVVVDIMEEIAKHPAKRIYFCTPNLDSVMGFKFWFHMPTHVNAMHPHVIRAMFDKMGFSVLHEWTEYGGLPGSRWKLALRKWILIKVFGPVQAKLFEGGANVCFVAESPAN